MSGFQFIPLLIESDQAQNIWYLPRLPLFPQYSDETLAVFKSFKLDDTQASRKKREEMHKAGGEHVYFAKFLTSEKVRALLCTVINIEWEILPPSWCYWPTGVCVLQLMDLQLSDSNFRRHILLQYLILFQYLKGQVKFKRWETQSWASVTWSQTLIGYC